MHEPTTISEVVRLIAEVLEREYGVDATPLLAEAGIDKAAINASGSRVSRPGVMRLWRLAEAATGDGAIGLNVGFKMRPTTFHALSVAFISCDTLGEALEFLCHYYRVIATIPLELHLVEEGPNAAALTIRYSDPQYPLLQVPFDSFIAAIVALCRIADTPALAPLEVRLAFPDNGRREAYEAGFKAPAVFDAKDCALVFARADLDRRLSGHSHDIFVAADGVLQSYLDALQPEGMTSRIRKELVRLLPLGKANQTELSKRLSMAPSTMQRRLRAENTSYRGVLASVQRTLAVEYVRQRRYSLGHIAFMLGFSEQSSFTRAFRRWTGLSPKAFRHATNFGSRSASGRAHDDASAVTRRTDADRRRG